MTLTERMAHCHVEGCRRTPPLDQAYCNDHRVRWLPEWRRRSLERPEGLRKDLTGAA